MVAGRVPIDIGLRIIGGKRVIFRRTESSSLFRSESEISSPPALKPARCAGSLTLIGGKAPHTLQFWGVFGLIRGTMWWYER